MAIPPGGKAHVGGDVEVWEEAVVLGQIADAPVLGVEVDAVSGIEPRLAAETDPAVPRALEPGDGPQQRRLARPGRPDQRNRLGSDAQGRAKLERSPR